MIDPKELRIGNVILLDTNVAPAFPHVVMPKDIYDIAEGKITLKSVEPIKLSKGILEKCGFTWNESINHWTKNWGRNGVHFIKKDDAYTGYSFQLGTHHYKIVDSLHQLQNLFFALTESELKINLNE